MLLWPFDGDLFSLFKPASVVIAETYPAECCRWFSANGIRSKRDQDERKEFGLALIRWADASNVALEGSLRQEVRHGFPQGEDDAFDLWWASSGCSRCVSANVRPANPWKRQCGGWKSGFLAGALACLAGELAGEPFMKSFHPAWWLQAGSSLLDSRRVLLRFHRFPERGKLVHRRLEDLR